MPEISVIVPVYNVENKIRRCIESIIDQTFNDFELLMIDDGSVDKSGKICDEYAVKDNRIKVIHQENHGVSFSRNSGISKATGKYIGFVDSDDFVHKDYLKELYCVITDKDADIAMCNFFSKSSQEENYEPVLHGFDSGTCFDHAKIEQIIYNRIFYNDSTYGYFSLWNKLIRRALIIDNAVKLDDTMSFGEDMLFVMQCLKYCRSMAFSDKALYYYEMSQTGLFSSYRASFLEDIMRCYETIIEQTKPETCDNAAYIPLSLKYFRYIERYENGIIENEKNKIRKLYKLFKNRSVTKIFKTLVMATDEQKQLYNIDNYDLRVPKLVLRKKLILAAFYAMYQLDDKMFVKRIRIKIQGLFA